MLGLPKVLNLSSSGEKMKCFFFKSLSLTADSIGKVREKTQFFRKAKCQIKLCFFKKNKIFTVVFLLWYLFYVINIKTNICDLMTCFKSELFKIIHLTRYNNN